MALEPTLHTAKTGLSLWKRFSGFIRDFGAMPGNMRKMAEARDAEADARAHCRSCADGRVGQIKTVDAGQGYLKTTGVCDRCGVVWLIDNQGKLQHPSVGHR